MSNVGRHSSRGETTLPENELTDAERALVETLPTPPAVAEIRTTNVWIIEWLSQGEPHTGHKLHEWIESRRPGWSIYNYCETKAQVIQAIERASLRAQQTKMVPVLHLEAHGCDAGLTPHGTEYVEWLSWQELTVPLQQLNLATQCNLVVVVAACVGFAAIQALRQGPRAPAVALVGLDTNVEPSALLWGTKEFYRRWLDEKPSLTDIAASASRETGTANFEWEPFATLCHEALVESLVKSIRPTEQLTRMEKFRQRMHAETKLSASEVENRLAEMPRVAPWADLQRIWDEMFMIDLYPRNRESFGIDMREIVERIEKAGANGQT